MNSKMCKVALIVGLHVVVIGGLLMMGSCKPKSKTTPSVTPPPGAPAVGAVTPAPEVTPPPPPLPLTTAPALETRPAAKAPTTCTVVKGDTLSGIAHKQGTTVTAIKRANNLTGDVIRVGQKLTIPSLQESGQKEIGGPAPKKVAARKSGRVAPKKVAAPAAADAAVAAGGQYIVESGDTPEKIAKKLGIKTSALMDANPGLDAKKLQIGQKLSVPGAAPAPAPGAPAAPAGVGAGATMPEPAPTVPATTPSVLPLPPSSGPSTPAPNP